MHSSSYNTHNATCPPTVQLEKRHINTLMLNFCKFDIEKCCSSASCNKKCNFKNTFLKMMSAAINSLGMSWCNSSFAVKTDASMSDDFFSRDKSPGIEIKQLSVSYKHFNQCDFQGQIKRCLFGFLKYKKSKSKQTYNNTTLHKKKALCTIFLSFKKTVRCVTESNKPRFCM